MKNDINKVAASFLANYLALAGKAEVARMEEESRGGSDRFDVDDPPASAQPTAFVVLNDGKYFHGTTPSGRAVYVPKIDGAKVFYAPEQLEDGKALGEMVPCPWHLLPMSEHLKQHFEENR